MALESGPAQLPIDDPVFARSGVAKAEAGWQALLIQLGPVLVLSEPARHLPHAGAYECRIDSFGVRESVWLDERRIFRLPDSDYFGWERIAPLCRVRIRPRASSACAPREARLQQANASGWQRVARLSRMGWAHVELILHLERARLVRDGAESRERT